VGIAMLAALIDAGSLSGGAVAGAAGAFALQLGVGLAVGVLGGRALLLLMHHVALPLAGLYRVRALVGAALLFGLASALHGSGFLAVFVAGILLGDEQPPYRLEIGRFHAALASVGEVVAFVFLGLTLDLEVLSRADVWVPGLALGLLLAVVVRPLLAAPMVLMARLRPGETAFVLLAGLKGAVPLLLGLLLLPEQHGQRLYGVVAVVVLFSVVVQGSAVPWLVRRLHVR
jgi:cell volume regulation protein A